MLLVENQADPCSETSNAVTHRITDAYIWTTQAPASLATNKSDRLIKLDYHYHLSARPGYIPYTYPHPLRVN